MKILNSINKIIKPALFVALLGFSGCLRDSADVTPDNPVKANGITLNLSVPGMQTATRAGFSENAIDKLDILVFDSSNKFVEYGQAEVIATELAGGSITQAYFPMSPGLTNFKLMAIANMHDKVIGKIPTYAMPRDTFLKTLEINQGTGNDYALWNNDGSEDQIPMFGETGLISANPSAGQAVSIDMVRSLARIDFTMEDSSSDFSTIAFCNFGVSSPLTELTNTVYVPWGTSNLSVGFNPTVGEAGPYYVHVQDAVSEASSNGYLNSPHIVVRAKYDTKYYFYRINITSDGSVAGYAKGEYIPIMRNYRYNVVIHEVNGPGYGTQSEASEAKGEVNNLTYNVMISNESQGGNIVYDGNYMLSTDKEEVHVSYWGGGGSSYGSTLTIYTNYNSLVASGGWKATTKDSWLRLAGDSGSNVQTLTGKCDEVATIKVYPVINNPSSSSARTGTVTITAGKLETTVKVIQAANSPSIIIEVAPEDTDIVKWVTWKGTKILDGPEYAEVYVESSSASDGFTVSRAKKPAATEYGVTARYFSFLYKSGAGYYSGGNSKDYSSSTQVLKISPMLLYPGYMKFWDVITFNPSQETGITKTLEVMSNDLYAENGNYKDAKRMVFSADVDYRVRLSGNTHYTFKPKADVWPSDVPAPAAYTDETFATQYADKYSYRDPATIARYISQPLPDRTDVDSVKLTYVLESVPYPGAETQTEVFEYWTYPIQPLANSYIVKPNTMFGGIPVWQFTNASGYTHGVADDYRNTTMHEMRVIWSDTPGVVKDLSLAGYGTKAAAFVKAGVEGNAVIGYYTTKSSVETLIWTWHIWVTADKDVIEAGTGTGNIWMDRNLGAFTATNTGNPADYGGLFYQWGRKEPFPRSNTYYTSGTTATTFSTSNNASATITTLETSIRNPLLYAESGWRGSSGASSWGSAGSKAVYDPCPPGWKVPRMALFPTSNGVYSNGFLIFTGETLPTLPVLSGYRDGAALDDYVGKYWFTDTQSLHESTLFTNFIIDKNGKIGLVTSNPSNTMSSVRCTKE